MERLCGFFSFEFCHHFWDGEEANRANDEASADEFPDAWEGVIIEHNGECTSSRHAGENGGATIDGDGESVVGFVEQDESAEDAVELREEPDAECGDDDLAIVISPEIEEACVDAIEEFLETGHGDLRAIWTSHGQGFGCEERGDKEDDEDGGGSDHLLFDEEFLGIVVVIALSEFGHEGEAAEIGSEVDDEIDGEHGVHQGFFAESRAFKRIRPNVGDDECEQRHAESGPGEPFDMALEDRVDDGRHDEHTTSHEEHGKDDRNAIDRIGKRRGDDDETGADTRKERPNSRTRQRERTQFPLRRVFPPPHNGDKANHHANRSHNGWRKNLTTAHIHWGTRLHDAIDDSITTRSYVRRIPIGCP